MRWIVFDYGEVIAFRPAAFTPLADLLGAETEAFEAAYWRFRDAYDRGLPDHDYWRAVGAAAGVGEGVGAARADELAAADVAVWQSTDPAALALIDDLAVAGHRLALLSNAPAVHARAFREQSWAKRFEHILVSGEIGAAKPDPAVWQALVHRLRADPAACLFLDDRQANVDAALSAGLQAVRWTSAERLGRGSRSSPAPGRLAPGVCAVGTDPPPRTRRRRTASRTSHHPITPSVSRYYLLFT